MITLNNLTQEQVEMLDTMWQLDSYEDYDNWFESLSKKDRRMAETLQTMVIAEEMEKMLGDCVDAKNVLSKFSL
jgi:uncharacterized protein YukE